VTDNIRFLSVENVLALQADTIHHEGGLHGVRDTGLLEAAVSMPQQQWGGSYLHEDLAAMAAAYHFHLAANHPFLDGNKRAAVLAALVFLDVNGIENLPDPVELERITLEVAASERNKENLTLWWREQLEATQ
jgi:death on curing protein